MKTNLIFLVFVFFIALTNLDYVFADPLSCCLEASGYCSPNKESGACVSGGGSVVGPGGCYDASGESPYDQCKRVGCIFANDQCSFIPNSRCVDVFDARVDNTITNQKQCDDINYNVNRGCCLPDCRMKLRNQCSGEFDTRECDAVSQCKTSGVIEICSKDGRAIQKVDNKGKEIRLPELCPEDRKCVVENNKPGCKLTSCEIGEDTFFIEKVGDQINVERIDLGLSRPIVETVEIDADVLGLTSIEVENGRTFRKNGESWCIIYGTKNGRIWEIMPKSKSVNEIGEIVGVDNPALEEIYLEGSGREYSAGQRHSVYSCNDGNIIVERGDVFRGKNGVCFENNQDEYYFTGEDRKWGMCKPRDDKERKKADDALERADNNVFNNVDENSKNPLVIAHRNAQKDPPFSQAILVDNYDFDKDCKAIYPVGSRFYPPPYSQTGIASINRCGKCGGSAYDANRCGENECYRAGDCRFKGAGVLQRAKDCGKGAVIVWSTYRLGNSLLSSGSAPPGAPGSPAVPTGPPASLPSAPFVPPEAGSAAGEIVVEQATQTATSQIAQQAVQQGAQLSNWRKLQIAAETTNAVSGTFYLARSIRQGNSPSYLNDDPVGTVSPGDEIGFDKTWSAGDGSVRGHPIGHPNDYYVVLSTGESGTNSLVVEN